jgi:hypothetical protein
MEGRSGGPGVRPGSFQVGVGLVQLIYAEQVPHKAPGRLCRHTFISRSISWPVPNKFSAANQFDHGL